MNTQYRFYLSVETPDGKIYKESFAVDAFLQHTPFRSIDRCSDTMTAFLTHGHTPAMSARIDTERKELAQQIAAKLADSILAAIKHQDTVNGYQQ